MNYYKSLSVHSDLNHVVVVELNLEMELFKPETAGAKTPEDGSRNLSETAVVRNTNVPTHFSRPVSFDCVLFLYLNQCLIFTFSVYCYLSYK